MSSDPGFVVEWQLAEGGSDRLIDLSSEEYQVLLAELAATPTPSTVSTPR